MKKSSTPKPQGKGKKAKTLNDSVPSPFKADPLEKEETKKTSTDSDTGHSALRLGFLM